MLVNFYQTTRRQIPNDNTLHSHRCEDLTSIIKLGVNFAIAITESVLGADNYLMSVVRIHMRGAGGWEGGGLLL
jgi:hypothetical protein